MGRLKTPLDELEELLSRSTVEFKLALDRVARARIGQMVNYSGEIEEYNDSLENLGNVITATQRLAAVYGQKRLQMEADQRMRRRGLEVARFAAEIGDTSTPIIPKVPFEDAIRGILRRDPRLAAGYQRVSRVYNEGYGFALARSSSMIITEEIQRAIAQSFQTGDRGDITERVIETLGNFDRAYASVVYRTNVTSAYTSGRMIQAEGPDLDEFVVGYEFVAVMDVDTRRSHAASHGFIAGKRDPAWLRMAPPKGYNCRCTLEWVDRIEADEKGMLVNGAIPRKNIPPGAENEPSFVKMSFESFGV